MKFRNYLNEVKARRAWSGKLKRIDKLLAWMYDNDILNKGEKNKKDTLFNKYYRYYNDGDFPKGLKDKDGNAVYKGMQGKYVEEALEYQLEEYMKKVLSKYSSKIDKVKFKNDEIIDTIDDIFFNLKYLHIDMAYKNLKDSNDLQVKALVFHLNKKYNIIQKAIGNNHTLSYNYENGLVTDKYKSTYDEILVLSKKLQDRLELYKTGVKKLKQLNLSK